MADIVPTASQKTSKEAAASDHILERLEALADQYREECRPESAMVYHLKNEEEAAQILLAMAATIKLTAPDVRNQIDKSLYLRIAREYRLAVTQGRALQSFREMTKADQLSLYGLKLLATRIVSQ